MRVFPFQVQVCFQNQPLISHMNATPALQSALFVYNGCLFMQAFEYVDCVSFHPDVTQHQCVCCCWNSYSSHWGQSHL